MGVILALLHVADSRIKVKQARNSGGLKFRILWYDVLA
jgi:hypothetical protein